MKHNAHLEVHPSVTRYRKGCRCIPCVEHYREVRARESARISDEQRERKREAERQRRDVRNARRPSRAKPRPQEDGIVDWVVVERLAAGVMSWRDATRGEREDAARRMLARGDGWDVVTERTGLRHTTVKRLRDEVAA